MKRILSVPAPGNRRRSYRQDQFILSTFNLSGNSRVEMSREDVDKAVKKLKKLGLNLIETAHAADSTAWYALEVCQREGMDVLFQDYYRFGGFQEKFNRPTTEDEVKQIVEETRKFTHVKGYYIWDEPWEEPDVASAARQTDWFDKYAPGKHAFSVMVPNYNPKFDWKNGKYPWFVEHYLDTVQPPVASFDYYPFGEGTTREYDGPQLDNSNVWKDMGVVRRAALKRNLPFWFYFQTLRTAEFPTYHFSMTKLQINYALMYGVKGLQCYGLAGALVSPDKLLEKRRVLELDYEEGCFFDDLRAMIAIVKNLGRTMIALTSDRIYHGDEVLPEDGYFNANFRESIREDDVFALETLPFRCSIGRLSDPYGNQYAAILNRDYVRANTFVLPLKKQFRVYEVSKADGEHYCIHNGADCLRITLEAGDMVIYRLQDTAGEEYAIAYEITES